MIDKSTEVPLLERWVIVRKSDQVCFGLFTSPDTAIEQLKIAPEYRKEKYEIVHLQQVKE